MRRDGWIRATGCTVIAAAVTVAAWRTPAAADPSFAVPTFVHSTEVEPIDTEVSDVNGDGRQDVVVIDRGARAFEVYLGVSNGLLERQFPALHFTNDPQRLVPGDFDADGRPDFMIVTRYTPGYVVLNRGAGRFESIPFTFVGPVFDAVARRFDGDAQLDAVLLRASDGALIRLRGDGTGLLQDPLVWAQSQIGASALVSGDFDADGFPDVAVAGVANHVFFGGANGRLEGPVPLAGSARSAAVADVDADGKLDLVTAGDLLIVHLGRGDRSFLSSLTYTEPGTLRELLLVDLNGDARLDAVRVPGAAGGIGVRFGAPGGAFGSEDEWPLGSFPAGLAAGDLDGDGDFDLAITTPSSNALRLLVNSGDGTIGRRRYPMGSDPQGLVAGDWNRDGALDLMVANPGAHTLTMRLGAGDGTLGPAQTIPVPGQPRGLAAGDLDGDGICDVAVRDDSAQAVRTYRGRGDGTFAPVATMACAGLRTDLQLRDLDADGALDVAGTSPGTGGGLDLVGVLRGVGDGSLHEPYWFETQANPVALAIADLDASGAPDLAAVCRGDAAVSLLLGNGDATFYGAKSTPHTGSDPAGVGIADWDGDGNLDLVIGHAGPRGVSIHRGDGRGEFAAPFTLSTETSVRDVRLEDLDRDGWPDLVVTRPTEGIVSLVPNRGHGDFGSRSDFGLGTPVALLFAPLDGDDLPELVMTEAQRGEIVVLINTSTRTPIRVEDFAIRVEDGIVRLTWRFETRGEPDPVGIAVERAPTAAGPWSERTGRPLPVEPEMTFAERLEPGSPAAWYRLVLVRHDGRRVVLVAQQSNRIERSGRVALGAPIVTPAGTVRIPFSLPVPLAVQLAVYDVRGRQVWESTLPRADAGPQFTTWDGRDAAGLPAGRGVYIVRLEAGGTHAARKLVRVHR